MADRIVLISNDSNFFDYIKNKLELRKSDELFMFSFDEIPEKLHLLTTSVLIINSENSQSQTLELLKMLHGAPSIVMSFNEEEVFKRKCYRAGMFEYMPLMISDADFRAGMIPALSTAAILEKNRRYRDILVLNKVITPHNEVFLDYNHIIDKALSDIDERKIKAVFAAISPNEKTKFLLHPNMIETIILNNIRKNDILMNYAPNKYFLLLYDTDIKSAEKLWNKISGQMSQQLYAGFVAVTNQKYRQLVDKALNKLHEAINNDKIIQADKPIQMPLNTDVTNFKLFRQEFGNKIEQVITPAFYHMQQKYSCKFSDASIEQGIGEGYGTFYIKGKKSSSSFRITSPGFAKINIDITYQKDSGVINAKRITLEPEELEEGLLEDLLEQFILEYRNGG